MAQQRILDFIRVLRNSDVRVSTSETLDAMHATKLLGYRDRRKLEDGLAAVLAKSSEEKEKFHYCFQQFFGAEFGEPATHTDEQNPNSTEDTVDNPAADDKKPETAPDNQDQGQQEGAENADDAHSDSDLLASLDSDNWQEIELMMEAAAEAVDVDNIQHFTQRGQYTRRLLERMGIGDLDEAILQRAGSSSGNSRQSASQLEAGREVLREMAKSRVERSYLLFANAESQQLRDRILSDSRISNIDSAQYQRMQELVHRICKRLVAQYSRKKYQRRRGQLNSGKTLRRNVSHQGILFDTYWRARKKDRPQVFAICDVSGSVSRYAIFLLTFLYSLNEVLPKVRAFVFSTQLGEVSELFAEHNIETALGLAMENWGRGSTDYGQALLDFKSLALADLRPNSTVIVLGDARNNHGRARVDILREVQRRCGRILWLNPEPESIWDTGDSVMSHYRSCCHRALECSSLKQLERAIAQLLQAH